MIAAFSYDVAASLLQEGSALDGTLAGLESRLGRAGGHRQDSDSAPLDRPLFHLVLTGGTERTVLDRLERRARRAGPEPVVLLSHPDHNSLPAALEILARVRQRGGVGRIVDLGHDAGAAVAKAALLAGAGLRLRAARIGAFGPPSDWLVASSQPPEVVRASWGPLVVPIPMDEVLGRLDPASREAEVARDLATNATPPADPHDGEVARATVVLHVLRDLAREHRLDALTLRCFDLVAHERTTGCLALSCLADEGIPAGCEGDVPSVVALLWLRLLTGEAGWMANPARLDPRSGEVLLAHCTVPRGMVAGYRLQPHFESGLGVALGGDLAPGPVTLLRIGGADLRELWLGEGELLRTVPQAGLCRTQARVRTDPELVRGLLERPLGNHVVLARGHRGALLRDSHRLLHPGA